VQSEFQRQMLSSIDDDVQYLREHHNSLAKGSPASAEHQGQVHQMLSTNRGGRDGGWRFSGPEFSETSSTPEVIDITPSDEESIISEEGRGRTSTHSMERRSSSQRQRFQQIRDTLPFDEMSFSEEDSSDESFNSDDVEEEIEDDSETMENESSDIPLNDTMEIEQTVGHRSKNLFPVTPNVSAAYWTAPPTWPTPNLTTIPPTPGVQPAPGVQAPNTTTGTLRVAVPPTIDMVYSATWEKLEQLRKQIEVAERMQFNVHFAGYLDPSVIKAIERSVLTYYTENGQAMQHEKHIWMRWSNAMFFNIVNGRFHMTVEAKTTKQDFLDEARKIVFTYHEVDSAKEHKYIDDMETALRKTNFMTQLSDETADTFTVLQRRELFKDLLKKIRDDGKGPVAPRNMLFEKMTSKIQGMNRVYLFSEFLEELIVTTELCRSIFKELKPYLSLTKPVEKLDKASEGSFRESKPKNREEKGRDKGGKSKAKNSSVTDRSGPSATRKVQIDHDRTKEEAPFCDTCGHNHYNARTGSNEGMCRQASHPDANLKGKWKSSVVGKKYMELRPARPYLDSRHKLNASKTELVEMAPYSSGKATTPKSLKRTLKRKLRFYPYALRAQMMSC